MADSNAQSAPAPQNPQVNPLDLPENQAPKADSSNILQSIVKTETGEGAAAILQDAPELDQALLQTVGAPKNFLLSLLKIIFLLLVIGSIASFLFFNSQLTNRLDFVTSRFDLPNVSAELASSNTEIITLQTEINFHRYLKAKAYLDEFSYYGDAFMKNYEVANSQTTSNVEKNQAEDDMDANRERMKNSLLLASEELLTKKFSVTLVSEDQQSAAETEKLFETKLIDKLKQNADKVSEEGDEASQIAALNFIHTANLVGNEPLFSLLASADIDAMTNAELYDYVKEMNGEIVNNLSIIQQIKEKRIKWSDIMQEIENKTIAIDPNYSLDAFEQFGGIRYTSYDLDSSGPRISITGETKRFDTINFTIIVSLIEKLNESPFFENGEMKSFTKSGSFEEGYTANLKITLDLEQFAEEDPIDQAPADSDALFNLEF